MKLTELQNVLGEEILKLREPDAGEEVIRRSQTIAMLAKQVINNADIIIRFDKMKSANPELSSRIEGLI